VNMHQTTECQDKNDLLIPLQKGDVILIDGNEIGELRSVTETGLVFFDTPLGERELGKAELQSMIRVSQDVQILNRIDE